MPKGVFVSGIDTEVGKTIVSAVITKALKADYWKAVQAGDLASTDGMKVSALLNDESIRIHKERYRLKTPASPHHAAELEGLEIKVSDFRLPKTENFLVVEGAGGLLVPLNRSETILDLVKHLGLPVLLVSRHYLGSINHSLLSLSCLKREGIPLAGLVFNGPPTPSSSSIIEQLSGTKALFHLPQVEKIDHQQLTSWAGLIRERLEKSDFIL